MANPSFLERFAARVQPRRGVFASIEEPIMIVRIGTIGLLGSAASAAGFAGAFLYFSEAGAAVATFALAGAFALIWLWWVAGPRGGDPGPAMVAVLVATSLNNLAVHLLLGGFRNSGGYVLFGIGVVLAATLAVSQSAVVAVAGAYGTEVVALGLLESWLSSTRDAPDPALTTLLFIIVLLTNLTLLVWLFTYLLAGLTRERARAERLLLNVLPEAVAVELKRRGRSEARRFDGASVLFADIVGFTPMTAEADPEVMVERLNSVFTFFDGLVERYGCEKIRTIGDAYMVAAGVPTPRGDHAEVLALMALDMLDYARNGPLRFRIGISSGPVVAGVIGRMKFQYDVWGDTVNIASRMESHGVPGRIQISEPTFGLIGGRFRCESRGQIEIKGRGSMSTWFLDGPVDPTVDAESTQAWPG